MLCGYSENNENIIENPGPGLKIRYTYSDRKKYVDENIIKSDF